MLTIRDFCLTDASIEPKYEVGEIVHYIPDKCDRMIRGRVYLGGEWGYWIKGSPLNAIDKSVYEHELCKSQTKFAQRTIPAKSNFSEGQYVTHLSLPLIGKIIGKRFFPMTNNKLMYTVQMADDKYSFFYPAENEIELLVTFHE